MPRKKRHTVSRKRAPSVRPARTHIRKTKRYGWIPDIPDQRDFLYAAPPAFLRALPPRVDLRKKCPPVYDQGQLGSCHDAETEALTRQGWKCFAELSNEDQLASISPDDGRLSWAFPRRIVSFAFEGDLFVVEGRSLNFAVTPDHKMLVRKWDERARSLSDAFELRPIGRIGWYSGFLNRIANSQPDQQTFVLPGVAHKRRRYRTARVVPASAWLQFIGLYLAEGTLLKDTRRRETKIQIAAAKEREKAFARNLFSQLSVHALELKDRFTFNDPQIYAALTAAGLRGVPGSSKFIPDFVFELGPGNMRDVLEGHFMGDGCEQTGHRSHYTGSQRLADDLQRLILLSGQWGSVTKRERTSVAMIRGRVLGSILPEFRVSVWQKETLSLERRQLSRRAYSGLVYCAEVNPHHTLITRRKGKMLISGNCTANAVAGAIEFDQMKEHLPQVFIPSRLFIYYNERVIEGTINTDSGAMLRDGIKTVAKQGACPEPMWPYIINKFKTKPSASCYTEAAKHTAVNYERLVQSLTQMQGCLASGYPFVFGFTVYESFETDAVARTGHAPMPESGEVVLGGHAVCAVGYDVAQRWFLCRNSWGKSWGMKGYFTIPFAYLTDSDLSADFWTIRVVQ